MTNYRGFYPAGYRPAGAYRIGAYGDGAVASAVAALFVAAGSPLLWYSAQNIDGLSNSTMIDGQLIGTWVNLGSLGSAANLVGAGAARPTFRLGGVLGHLNNKSSVQWAGGQTMTTSTFTLTAQPITWVFLIRGTAGASQVILGGNGSLNLHQLYNATGPIHVYAGSDVPSGQSMVANTFHQVGFVANGASSTGNLDGAVTGSLNPGATSIDGIRIGSDNGPGNFWTGYSTEIMAYSGSLVSQPTLPQITAPVTAYYGATPA